VIALRFAQDHFERASEGPDADDAAILQAGQQRERILFASHSNGQPAGYRRRAECHDPRKIQHAAIRGDDAAPDLFSTLSWRHVPVAASCTALPSATSDFTFPVRSTDAPDVTSTAGRNAVL